MSLNRPVDTQNIAHIIVGLTQQIGDLNARIESLEKQIKQTKEIVEAGFDVALSSRQDFTQFNFYGSDREQRRRKVEDINESSNGK